MESFALLHRSKFVCVGFGGVEMGRPHLRVGKRNEIFNQLRCPRMHQPVGRDSLLHLVNCLKISLFAHSRGIGNHVPNLLRRAIVYPVHASPQSSHEPLGDLGIGPEPAVLRHHTQTGKRL